jgi:hypothetical protein
MQGSSLHAKRAACKIRAKTATGGNLNDAPLRPLKEDLRPVPQGPTRPTPPPRATPSHNPIKAAIQPGLPLIGVKGLEEPRKRSQATLKSPEEPLKGPLGAFHIAP